MKQKTRYNERYVKPKVRFLLKKQIKWKILSKIYQEKTHIYTILIIQMLIINNIIKLIIQTIIKYSKAFKS